MRRDYFLCDLIGKTKKRKTEQETPGGAARFLNSYKIGSKLAYRLIISFFSIKTAFKRK